MMNSFLWHDYETFGRFPHSDRIAQFAAIRTNLNFEPIDSPINIYCQPPTDTFPDPNACLLTGITPQQAMDKGLLEHQFAKMVNQFMSQPDTCVVGYNNIRFDDEMTRYLLYRNFIDPYQREWSNGNSRWDIIDMVRLVYALRPETLQWRYVEVEGGTVRPSIKLEHISVDNQLDHEQAHDALSDVRATIAVAKLIKQRQPKLFDYCLGLKRKSTVSQFIDLQNPKPLLHISGRFSAMQAFGSLVLPICKHPRNDNGVIVADLRHAPAEWINLDVEEMHNRLYTSTAELDSKHKQRLPIKVIHLNKSPVIATIKLVDTTVEERLKLNVKQCVEHMTQIDIQLIKVKMNQLFNREYANESGIQESDPEKMLYTQFIPQRDKGLCRQITQADAQQLATTDYHFEDQRMPELLLRYKGRNFPEILKEQEKNYWLEYKKARLLDLRGGASIAKHIYYDTLETLEQKSLTVQQLMIIKELREWGDFLLSRIDE